MRKAGHKQQYQSFDTFPAAGQTPAAGFYYRHPEKGLLHHEYALLPPGIRFAALAPDVVRLP